MPLTVIDYLIIFASSIIGGMLIAHLIIYVYGRIKKRPIAIEYISEKIADLSERGEEASKQITVTMPVITELDLLEEAIKLNVFSTDELVNLTGLNEDAVRSWIKSAQKQSILKELSSNVFSISLDTIPIEKLENLSRLMGEYRNLTNTYNELILQLNRRDIGKLADLGIKNIIYVGWDEEIGPKIDYFIYLTRFVRRALEDPSFLGRIMVSGEISVSMETEEGDKIVIIRIEVGSGERLTPNNLIAEITQKANIEKVKHFLTLIKERIRENIVNKDEFIGIISEALRSS